MTLIEYIIDSDLGLWTKKGNCRIPLQWFVVFTLYTILYTIYYTQHGKFNTSCANACSSITRMYPLNVVYFYEILNPLTSPRLHLLVINTLVGVSTRN